MVLRKTFFLLFTVLACAWLGAAHLWAEERVIVLGFDGVTTQLLDKWMAEGKLPNLSKLAKDGTYRRMQTANPAQSPVCWSSFSTGMNPGKHRIFGFLRRVQRDYGPAPVPATAEKKMEKTFTRPAMGFLISLGAGVVGFFLMFLPLLLFLREHRRLNLWISSAMALFFLLSTLYAVYAYLPEEVPTPVCCRRGKTVWDILSEYGRKATTIMAPVDFPPKEEPFTHVLCGLGVPDIRQTHGTWIVYDPDAKEEYETETAGHVIPLKMDGDTGTAELLGPYNPFVEDRLHKLREKLRDPRTHAGLRASLLRSIEELKKKESVRVPLQVFFNPDRDTAEIELQGQVKTAKTTGWTDWYQVRFRLSPLLSIYGLTRFAVQKKDNGKLCIFQAPVCFHPKRLPPTVRISNPKSYAGEMADKIGLYNTLGWAIMTNPLEDEMIDEDLFMADLNDIMDTRRKMILQALEDGDWDCFIGVFYATDRIQHMMWRLMDPKSPAYDPKIAAKYSDAILRTYQKMDQIVGEVRRRFVKDNVLFMVISDHGFQPFERSFNVNTWLREEGYLCLRGQTRERKVADLVSDANLFSRVDWRRTQAYSLGLGKVFINLKGRERFGIVEPGDEYNRLVHEICKKLENYVDEDNGKHPIIRAYPRDEIFSGPYVKEAADIFIGFAPGYRVSWQSTLGGVSQKVIEVNRRKWSADHCSLDPSVVPAMFFCNRKVEDKTISIMDLAPTILKTLHVPVPKEMDGTPLHIRSEGGKS